MAVSFLCLVALAPLRLLRERQPSVWHLGPHTAHGTPLICATSQSAPALSLSRPLSLRLTPPHPTPALPADFLRLFCISFTKKRPGQVKKTAYAQSSQVRGGQGEGRRATPVCLGGTCVRHGAAAHLQQEALQRCTGGGSAWLLMLLLSLSASLSRPLDPHHPPQDG